ncbi:tRNA(Ile)-lysidine synthetase (EC [Olavius algarvensis Delta 1 endosymbiont]|nr:tRNA(Ile)-lysidine synthetase (EC [Olavius algarvensis Delta 1 endosymbiont]
MQIKISVEKKVLRTVRRTIAEHRMLAVGDSVLIGVSGGPDSVALAYVLHTLAAEYSLRLAVAHVNHCLRGDDSDRDAEFVADTARQLGLPFYIEKKDVIQFQQREHFCLEEAGRKVRYRFFDRVCVAYGFNKIAVGHHGNDNAELVLMNLLRGSGPLGLSGIAPVRDGKIIRPLIRLERSEIVDYIAEKKLTCVADASNSDLSFRRNRIRHHLIPELEKSYNPAIIKTLNRLGAILRSEDQWIERLLRNDFSDCISVEAPGIVRINLKPLQGLDLAARRRIVRRAILTAKENLRRISLGHIDDVLSLIDKNPGTGSINLPDGIRVVRLAAELTIGAGQGGLAANDDGCDDSSAVAYRYSVAAPGTLNIRQAGAAIKLTEIGAEDLPDFSAVGKNLAFFDLDCLQFPLVVRNRRSGDRFTPLGLNGTQKLKKFFIDNKVPGLQRQLCPLVLSGGNIVWVAGHRIDDRVKVDSATRRILKAELLLA